MVASLFQRNIEYCLAAAHDEEMAMPVDAREGYAVSARLQLVKTISEAHGKPQIWKHQLVKDNERAAAMCEDLASKFRERGLWPFSRLVALDGSYLSVALHQTSRLGKGCKTLLSLSLNFAPYKNGSFIS